MHPETCSDQDVIRIITQLDQDRAWLLEQIDRGRWSNLRLDLAALERELEQLLRQVLKQCGDGKSVS
ncbi:hypothetical protein OMCYN_00232 [cyanobiont of Ornithocercus magnificus]|nr:hypothetical protein OMCYN_00232 [cyanobiont of Ornithocercus magnificus]